jgi:trk system potassium uptake protein TrkA
VSNKHDVVAIDINKEVCETIYAETGAMTVNGSATDINILDEAGAKKADVIICLMRSDADNIACALLSKSLGIPQIIGRLRKPQYQKAYKLAGVTVVRAADLLLNQILMEVEQPKVKRVMLIADGNAGIYSVKIPESGKVDGLSVNEVGKNKDFPKECVFMGIYKEDEGDFSIPRGNHIFEAGDTVYLISKSQYIKEATDFLRRTK